MRGARGTFLLAALLAGCVANPARIPDMPRAAGRGAAGSTDEIRARDSAWQRLGTTLEQRAVWAATFGDGDVGVYLLGGIHGDERGGVENEGRLLILLENGVPAGVRVRYVPDMNPDGSAARRRSNARGVDLNRNWPAKNFSPAPGRGTHPLSEPETAAVFADLEAFAPDVVIVLHAARRGPYVNFDGPARSLAKRFSDAAASKDGLWHLIADVGYGTPGSLGSLLGRDQDVPTLTIEFQRSHTGAEVWPALRAGLLAVLESLSVGAE